jgi:hypothetical protein
MKKLDIAVMERALLAIKYICEQYSDKPHGCDKCPANGKGKLCHSGAISCCAPHGWYRIRESDEDGNYRENN